MKEKQDSDLKKKKVERLAFLNKDEALKFVASPPVGTAAFIKVSRTKFYSDVINVSHPDCKGWLVQFPMNPSEDKLIFREIDNSQSEHELVIDNTANCSYVDTNLDNLSSGGSLEDIFPQIDLENFALNNSCNMFFYVSKSEVDLFYPASNFFFISRMILFFGQSATLTQNANNPIAGVINLCDIYQPGNGYPALKIEALQISPASTPAGSATYSVYGSDHVRARYILGVPCPPDWKPGFYSGPLP